jgi:hypothetical protein
MFSFQYCVLSHIVRDVSPFLDSLGELQYTYLDCISYDGLAVLDNEAKLWVMLGEN